RERHFFGSAPSGGTNRQEPTVAREEEVSERELIRRFVASEPLSLEALVRRYDCQLLAAIRRQLGPVRDRDHRAREILDDFWVALGNNRQWLELHDPRRRKLLGYLVFLVAHQVQSHQRGL